MDDRIAALPLDERGYPIPYFVAWLDGKPEFRMADPVKRSRCVRDGLCWVCGQRLGAYLAFTIGPMCCVNLTTAEPPAHLDCALWSVKGCPFLSRPKMVRREDELTQACAGNVAGEMIARNPGCIAVWVTKDYQLFGDGRGGCLIRIDKPVALSWWREGRPATRAEVMESIDSGLTFLEAKCDTPEDRAALKEAVRVAMILLPPA